AQLALARAEAALEIAEMRQRHFKDECAYEQVLFERGKKGSWSDWQQVQHQRQQAEIEVALRTLDVQEIRLTAAEPSDALSAPLVAGTDFVSRRLMLQSQEAQDLVALLTTNADRLTQLFEMGKGSGIEARSAKAQIAAGQAQQRSLKERIALRKSFLAGEMSPEQVELKDRRSKVIATREATVPRLDVLKLQHEHAKVLHEKEVATSLEADALEIEVRVAEIQLSLAKLELEIIERELQTASGG
ncbi:MAG: hypothetical protein IH988_00990, partial [Planctomycetes bacterium]|nr:hypothetical protein [Planctomycetota bacterium]